MKLNYITPPEDAGGAAIPGCGTIHKSEIEATLLKLSRELRFPFDLNNYTLASTGKREYSGDIDLVIDTDWYTAGHKAFQIALEGEYGKENVAKNGDLIHLKYPIVGYQSEFEELKPRTGFVQIDFNFGPVKWERFYHFSAGEESAYKGAHRNLAIAAICGSTGAESKEFDTFGRPRSTIRWKWGPKGFSKINRCSIPTEVGFLKKQLDVHLEGPFFNPAEVASVLFPVDGAEKDLESLETIIGAVKRNYNKDVQERIWKRIASNFTDWKDARNFIYPPEISHYFLLNDK